MTVLMVDQICEFWKDAIMGSSSCCFTVQFIFQLRLTWPSVVILVTYKCHCGLTIRLKLVRSTRQNVISRQNQVKFGSLTTPFFFNFMNLKQELVLKTKSHGPSIAFWYINLTVCSCQFLAKWKWIMPYHFKTDCRFFCYFYVFWQSHSQGASWCMMGAKIWRLNKDKETTERSILSFNIHYI